MDQYRTLLAARATVPEELAKVVTSGKAQSSAKKTARKPTGNHPKAH
jgi:hypothetical protein